MINNLPVKNPADSVVYITGNTRITGGNTPFNLGDVPALIVPKDTG
jgi:hypothetical protein